MIDSNIAPNDWRLMLELMEDLKQGFEAFSPYQHIRKITFFGSARIPQDSQDYQIAVNLASRITQQGFMVITGGAGGIMQAAQIGAGKEQSFGLHICLPYEEVANPFIEGNPKQPNFKYFLARKLFFFRESSAVVIFPGGMGTLDEATECLALYLTGRFGPAPIVFLESSQGNYWRDWEAFMVKHLIPKNFINKDFSSLYTITDSVEVASNAIASFYHVFHSSYYEGENLVLCLNTELSDQTMTQLNTEFKDILVQGQIEQLQASSPHQDETSRLSRLVVPFNRKDFGRLHQLIRTINNENPIQKTSLCSPCHDLSQGVNCFNSSIL